MIKIVKRLQCLLHLHLSIETPLEEVQYQLEILQVVAVDLR